MKKIYLTLFSALSIVFGAHAQYYILEAPNAGVNPGGLNSDTEETPAYVKQTFAGWSDVLTSTATDVWSNDQTIPFPFMFDGVAETSYKVSNTGVLTFNTAATSVPSSTNEALPSASIPDKSVCVWGLNLSGANDGVITKTFGTAPNRQQWIIYASASHAGVGTGYTYWAIVLEETTNAIYIVDLRTAGGNVTLTAGIQINSATAYSVGASPALGSLGSGASDPSDNSFYEFQYGSQPSEDMELVNYHTNPIEGIGSPLSSTVNVRTKGSNTVSSFEIAYSVNGSSPVTESFTTNLNPGQFSTVTLSTPYTPTTSGVHDFKIWIASVNSTTDQNNNNDTLSTSFIAANSVSRNFLAEEFSSSTCPPCKSWNDNVYNVALANYNKFGENKIVVKYQVPIPTAGDPSRNPHSDARRSYYGINSAPSMVANGMLIDYNNAPGGTWADAATYYNQIATAGAAAPAFVSITNAEANIEMIDATQMKVTVTADIEPTIDLNNAKHRAQIVVMQKEYTFNGATNGDFNYHHVARRMLPDNNGTALNVTAGNKQTITESYTFTVGGVAQGNFNLWNEDIEVLIKVEDSDAKTIMNAELATLTGDGVGLNEDASIALNLYPNPATTSIFVEGDFTSQNTTDIELVNSIGSVVYSQTFTQNNKIEIPVSELANGIYIVKVSVDGKTNSKRISVIR